MRKASGFLEPPAPVPRDQPDAAAPVWNGPLSGYIEPTDVRRHIVTVHPPVARFTLANVAEALGRRKDAP